MFAKGSTLTVSGDINHEVNDPEIREAALGGALSLNA
jgi:hypothetical protein